MIRIVRIVTRLNIGGPAHHVTVLASGLDRRAFQTLMVVGQPAPEEGDLTAAARRVGHVVTIPELGRSMRPWQDVIAWIRVFTVLMRVQPDIVHTHMAKAGALGRSATAVLNVTRWVLGKPRCRVLHTFHGHVLEGYFSPLATRGFLSCERWLARQSDRLIAINHSVRDALKERRIGRSNQVVVIPLGLSLNRLLELNGHQETVGSEARVWRLGIVGRLVPIKNHALLFEALQQLRQRAPSLRWTLEVFGDGELRGALEETARRFGLEASVRFAGWQQQTPDIYGHLDIICLSSNNEGSPVALIEALAATTPVIGTGVGGVGELLGGHCAPGEPFHVVPRGIVVRPSDPAAFAQALEWAMTHPIEHAQTAQAGHQYVRETFTANRLVNDIDRLYRQLVTAE